MTGEERLGLGSARRARGVGPGRGPERNHQGGAKFVDCVRMVHLRRDFQAMIDRGGPGEAIGRRLLALSDRLFELWHQARDDGLEESRFRAEMLRLRPRVRRALQDGSRCGCTLTAGTCAEILRVEEGLWNFVWFPGVEPTNNAAERALRHAVIWRRISGGKPLGKATRSPRSSR